jgi:DNA-binding transcriptional regulator YiaG
VTTFVRQVSYALAFAHVLHYEVIHADLHAIVLDFGWVMADTVISKEFPMTTKTRDAITSKTRLPKGSAKRPKAIGKSSVGAEKISEQVVSVRDLRERFGVSRKIFSRVVGFSERAIADWEAKKPQSEACLQRMREMARLQEALTGVMREDFVGAWLNTPNAAFAGLKPIEVIERGEIDRIWRMIYQLESGVPS